MEASLDNMVMIVMVILVKILSKIALGNYEDGW
jgi:hypothetical protein